MVKTLARSIREFKKPAILTPFLVTVEVILECIKMCIRDSIAIHDLMMIIVIGQAVVFLAEFFMPGLGIWSKLSLYMPAVLQGEVWRLLTFIFVPSSSTPLSLVLTLYLMWLIGHTLEQSWGDFRFNVYYFPVSYTHLTMFRRSSCVTGAPG